MKSWNIHMVLRNLRRKDIKEISDSDVTGKPQTPHHYLGTENLYSHAKLQSKWDLNWGPQRWKAGQDTTFVLIIINKYLCIHSHKVLYPGQW